MVVKRSVSTAHIAITLLVLSSLTAVFRAIDPRGGPVYHTYHMCAVGGVGLAFYYTVYQLIACLSPALRRRIPANISPYYSDASGEEHGADLVLGLPRLTMQSVWGLVYGLGMVFFALAFCFSGQQPLALAFLALGLSASCVWEIVEPGQHPTPGPLELGAMLLAGLVVFASALEGQSIPEAIAQMDLFSLAFGVVAPALAPLVLSRLRVNNRFYGVGNILELCEFGCPFLFILVAAFLCVADAPRLRLDRGWVEAPIQAILGQLANQTRQDPPAAPPDLPGFWVVLLAAPLLAAPGVVLFVAAVLRGHAADPLVALALFVVGVRTVEDRQITLLCLVNALIAACAYACRLASTSTDATEEPAPGAPMLDLNEPPA
jgi:hypothetical protein